MKQYQCALTIAGFDGGGGAGLQADLKVFSALRCYGTSVLTALPAQNTQEVRSITAIPVDSIIQQFDAVMEDIGAQVIKVGMLHREEVILRVAERLTLYADIPVVLDPVMVAKSGDRLLDKSAVKALKEHMIPKASVLTPNIPEAEALLGCSKIRSHEDMEQAAKDLLGLGCRSVVLKGGHLHHDDMSADVVVLADAQDQCHWVQSPRIVTANNHGTGCTYSAAIAAHIARGHSILPAVRLAKDYLSQAIFHGAQVRCGKGHGPLHHFFHYWKVPSLASTQLEALD